MEPARDGQGGRSEGRAAPRRERTARKARRGDGKRPFVPRRCRARRAVTRSIAASLAHGPGLGTLGCLGLVARSVLDRSAEHTSELQSLMRISYAVFCLK